MGQRNFTASDRGSSSSGKTNDERTGATSASPEHVERVRTVATEQKQQQARRTK